MKKIYEEPIILLSKNDDRDVIATSEGDTSRVNPFDW